MGNAQSQQKKSADMYFNEELINSIDLVGLIFYLSLKNSIFDISKAFKEKNSFKGKIGIFDIENNKINHRLNFYKIEEGVLKEIF